MIAIARPITPATPEDRFLAMLPAIRENARFAFRKFSAVLREDLIAEVVANAYCAFARLVKSGREQEAFATPLTDFAIRQVRAGRRVGSSLNVHDITSPAALLTGCIRVERLDRFDDEKHEWKEALIDDKKAGPAETAAARIDFAHWLRRLPRRDRQIAKALAKGETTKSVAKLYRLSPGRVSQLRRELHESWEELHGQLAVA